MFVWTLFDRHIQKHLKIKNENIIISFYDQNGAHIHVNNSADI